MALRRIALRDFVIVSSLELELEAGFSVLTGETGAGKSILVDALQLGTGARAEAGWVREGCPRTEVSLEFDAPHSLRPWLQEAGFDNEEPTLLLRRQVDAQGRSRAWINGTSATVQQLRLAAEQLLDIHGQHAWQTLTRPSSMRALLDAYGHIDTSTMAAQWNAWRHASAMLERAVEGQATLAQERERLQWQLSELDKLNPREHEWEEINAEHRRLAHSQSLQDTATQVLQSLHDNEPALIQGLHHALTQLQPMVSLDTAFAEPVELLESASAQVQEAIHTLRGYLRRSDPDPDRLAQLDERLGLWMSLARRYHRPAEALFSTRAQWQEQLRGLEQETDLAHLQEQAQSAQKQFLNSARTVSQARKKAAQRLQRAVSNSMQGLGMQGGQFLVALEDAGNPGPHGTDNVEFLVAGHAGSTARAVAKVASGGELSRIALAIAVCTSELGTAQTLVFDEVDAGIGGNVAHTVGQLMRQLGSDRQVLAVTHLPQVAACAHHHLRVRKYHDGSSTLSAVDVLPSPEQRQAEIARMLGDESFGDTSLAHAQAMLQSKQ